MILLNFAHPLTNSHLGAIEKLVGQTIVDLRQIPTQADHGLPFGAQATSLAEAAGLSSQQWQNEAILLYPPALSPLAACLLAEVHGRMGYFPALVRLRPVPGEVPPRFEVAEIINLNQVREDARTGR